MSDEKIVETIIESSENAAPPVAPRSRVKPKTYHLDLRIHSPVSLGYIAIEGIDTAPALVRLAKTKGLDVIAVTDFYSGAYIDRVSEAAKGSGLTVIPGVDLRCQVGECDDVHLSCLFEESFTTARVDEFLNRLDVPVQHRGTRNYVVTMPVGEILTIVESLDGAVLPSRMDKTPHRMAAIPALVEQFGFRSFDLAYSDTARFFKTRWPKIKFNLFSFSNANALAQIGSRSARVKLENPGFNGLKTLIARSRS